MSSEENRLSRNDGTFLVDGNEELPSSSKEENETEGEKVKKSKKKDRGLKSKKKGKKRKKLDGREGSSTILDGNKSAMKLDRTAEFSEELAPVDGVINATDVEELRALKDDNRAENIEADLEEPEERLEDSYVDVSPREVSSRANLNKRISAVPSRANLDKRLSAVPSKANLDKRLSAVPSKANLDKRISAVPSRANLDKRLSAVPSKANLDKRLSAVPSKANLDKRLSAVPSKANLGKRISAVPSRANLDNGLSAVSSKAALNKGPLAAVSRSDLGKQTNLTGVEAGAGLPAKVASKASLLKGPVPAVSKSDLGKKKETKKPPKKNKKRKDSSDSDEESSKRSKKKKKKEAAKQAPKTASPEKKVKEEVELKKEEPSPPIDNRIPIFVLILDGVILITAMALFVSTLTCRVVNVDEIDENQKGGDPSKMGKSRLANARFLPSAPDGFSENSYNDPKQGQPRSVTATPIQPVPSEPPYDLQLIPEDYISQSSAGYVCGKRIVNIQSANAESVKAPLYNWPWTVRLYKLTNIAKPICGATIVSPRHALSACHCIKNKRRLAEELKIYRIGCGTFGFYSQKSYHVSKIRFHPGCYPGDNGHDLSLVTLQKEVKFNAEVQPACLSQYEQMPTAAMNCWVSEWHTSNNFFPTPMIQHQVKIVPEKRCKKISTYNEKIESLTPFEKEMAFCGENSKLERGCYKEGGGSLTCEENGKWILYGVTSWGFVCEWYIINSFYAAVSHSLPWICCFMSNIPSCQGVLCDVAKY